MDIKRFFTQLLLIGGMMLLFMYFFRTDSNAPKLTHFAYYDHVPVYKAPEEYKAAEAGARPRQVVLGDIAPASTTGDKLSVTVSNVTAGIDQVRLKDYAQAVKIADPLTLFQAMPGKVRPFSTIGVHVRYKGAAKEIAFGLVHEANGSRDADNEKDDAETIANGNNTALLDRQYVWSIVEQTPTKAVMLMTLHHNGAELIRIRKTFETTAAAYDVTISHVVENVSGRELEVGIDQTGAIELPWDDPSFDDRYMMAMPLSTAKASVNGGAAVNITHQQMPGLMAGWRDEESGVLRGVGLTGIGQMNEYGKDPLLWVASANRFFTAIVRPVQEKPATTPPLPLTGAGISPVPSINPATHVQYVSLDLIHVDARRPEDNLAIQRFRGAMMPIAAGTAAAPKAIEAPLAVYFGPKTKPILGGELPAALPAEKEHALFSYLTIVQFNTCFLYNWCVFDWLVYGILGLLDLLAKYVAFGNYGVAIMILVILVRLALHPLTRMSQVNMAKMGKQMRDIQPKLEAIKKRYADNREKQTQETMKLYREHNISPAGGIMGCLPMLLQMPIWTALISGLRLDIDLRHAPFIPGWINDLSNPDTIIPMDWVVGHPLLTIPLVHFPIYGLNPLPILLAVVLFYNMKVTMATQPKPADEQQAQMQKWSMYSILLFPFFLYNASSGSNLYFFASTIGGLVDTYFIRKSLKRQGILPPSAKDLPTAAPEK